ncbi:MAG: hypothetical protein F6K65_10430 [Moorea sp. SIO3C2]|nr:hypothetical protein [Moorena sp. SIO3C2]
MPSIKRKTASVVAITALTVGLTPVLPAAAQENQSDHSGVVAAIIRAGIVGNAISERFGNTGGSNTRLQSFFGNNDGNSNTNRAASFFRARFFSNSVNNSQPQTAAGDLIQAIDGCATTGCNEMNNILQQADNYLEGF